MAVISDDTFDPLRRFVGVRLQQGVPIVDADWNEQEDVREFEVRAFLKWFVGDGIPDGNDGFRIQAIGAGVANDFTITRGSQSAAAGADSTTVALQQVGRCLVDGRDVIIPNDIRFTEQELHDSQANAAAAATRLEGTVIAALTSPAANGSITVYLDVWQRVVKPAEDATLVHTDLGVESCARVRREWAVRVRAGKGLPPDSERVKGHSYAELAYIARRTGDDVVHSTDITDRRERGLLLPPAHFIQDVVGLEDAAHFDVRDYRRSENRPKVSLRTAINSLLRGEAPMSSESAIPTVGSHSDSIGRANFRANQHLITLFESSRTGTAQAFVARLDLTAPTAEFAAPFAITTGAEHKHPHMALLSSGEWLLAYQSDSNILGRLGSFTTGSAMTLQPEFDVAADANETVAPTVVSAGPLGFIFYYDRTLDRYRTAVYDVAAASLDTTTDLSATTSAAVASDFHAVSDGTAVFAAFQDDANRIRALSVRTTGTSRGTADASKSITVSSTGSADMNPFLLPDGAGNCWLFFAGHNNALYYVRFLGDAWESSTATVIPGTEGVDKKLSPTAAIDSSGDILLFWQSTNGVGNQEIWYSRGKRGTSWETARRVTDSPSSDTRPHAVLDNDAVWLLWKRKENFQESIRYKQVYTRI